MFDGSFRFIDWTTAMPINDVANFPNFRQGHEDAFWPDPTGNLLQEKPISWDLYSFAYTLVFLGADVNLRMELLDYERRDKVIAQLANKDIDGLVRVGARMVAALKSSTADDDLYQLLNSCFD